MAMNYAWQERKKFAIPVAAGVVVLLIWYLAILSPINAATDLDKSKLKTAENQLRALMQAGVPQDEGVGRADRDRSTFQKDLKDVQDKLAFRVEENFKLKEGQGAAGKFGRLREEVRTKVEADRARKGFPEQIDTKLGFPQTVQNLPDPVLAEWLIRLAMVQRICSVAMECEIQTLKFVEVVPAEQQDEPTISGDRFIGTLPVKVRVTGRAESITRMIHGLQVEGPNYLALQAGALTAPDPTKDTLTAEITVGALIVKPEGTLAVEAKQ